METDKKEKNVPTVDDIDRIIGSYLGTIRPISIKWSDGKVIIAFFAEAPPSEFGGIKVTPLSKISDEDAIEINRLSLLHDKHRDNSITKYRDYNPIESGKLIIDWRMPHQCVDYLRSRGYALPYGKWSVEELEEFGIFKLEE